MRRVYQTTFGGPGAPVAERGNCLSACLASVLDLDLRDVPNFHVLLVTYRWSRRHDADARAGLVPGPYVLSGKSPRGDWNHSVVGLRGRVWHDPREGAGEPALEPHSDEWPWDFDLVCAGKLPGAGDVR